MDNQWIEWKGGECPVETGIKVDFRLKCEWDLGRKRTLQGAAKLVPWSEALSYRMATPDPHKEWVKIQEGCPMPEHGQRVVIFTEGEQHMGFVTNRSATGVAIPFFEDGPIPVSEIDFWRYPHPEPKGV